MLLGRRFLILGWRFLFWGRRFLFWGRRFLILGIAFSAARLSLKPAACRFWLTSCWLRAPARKVHSPTRASASVCWQSADELHCAVGTATILIDVAGLKTQTSPREPGSGVLKGHPCWSNGRECTVLLSQSVRSCQSGRICYLSHLKVCSDRHDTR